MEKLKHLQGELKHIERVNMLAPFPLYDTEYVELVKQEISNMNDDNKDYDAEPVVACKHCKELYIKVDDDSNDICMRCGSINEIVEYKDIYEYKEVNGK